MIVLFRWVCESDFRGFRSAVEDMAISDGGKLRFMSNPLLHLIDRIHIVEHDIKRN